MWKRKRDAAGDAADEVAHELQAAIDTCARGAEAELRQQADGGDKLSLLPDLVEALKVDIAYSRADSRSAPHARGRPGAHR